MIIRCHATGKDAAGLTRYLFGPGKANEHTNQRMITGSVELAGEWSGHELTMREATHLGRVVEASWRRQYAPELAMAGAGAGGIARDNLTSAADAIGGQDHVFHASLSLHADDAPLTDKQWAEVATKYVEAMGFTGVAGRPDCTWYAAHHGASVPINADGAKDGSKPGNDHIHVVVCATRRDGSRADLHNTGRRSQTVRREVLEKLPYLNPLHEEQRLHATPRASSYTAAEHNIARDRAARGAGPVTPDRVLLQRVLRAAAADATSEAAFINNVLKNRRQGDGAGLEIAAARWKPGTDKQEVSGYKVRFKAGTWFSASTLSPDLTLGKLRSKWTGETDASRSYAKALWAEQARVERRVDTPDASVHLDQAAEQLGAVNAALTGLDAHDVAAWNHVAAATAGATAVLSTATPTGTDAGGRETGFGADAGRASDALTRQWLADSYNQPGHEVPRVPTGLSGMELATRHLQLAVRASGTDRHQGWLTVIQQLARTMQAIADAKVARGEQVAAATLTRDAVHSMARLETWLNSRVDDGPAAGDPNAPTTGPELSPAAQAAREASGHANADRPVRPPTTPAPTPGHGDAQVIREPTQRRGPGPRRT